jgi:glycosyltransferase involved in cell wall biosynthesis
MNAAGSPRVLYSFPHKIGAGRICYTAWQQVAGIDSAGADVHLLTGALQKRLPPGVHVETTLARGPVRIPYRVLGQVRSLRVHDALVARKLPALRNHIDVIHTWPLGALRTLKQAARLGIPTVLERPNAHTRFAYEVVQAECERLGVELPRDHEHAYNARLLQIEEEEYRAADFLLCPSEFVAQSFVDHGFAPEKLLRHMYGFDNLRFFPATEHTPAAGLRILFVGVAAVRKGLHFALDAWVRSAASRKGTFLIAGEFLPAYRDKLRPLLEHPSVQLLGHRQDIPELMRACDVLVLPSIEEGSALVCTEAIGSGCVPLVSEAATDLCRHMENALVHPVGSVDELARHITAVDEDRALLRRLRDQGLQMVPELTWAAAADKLLEAYRSALTTKDARARAEDQPPRVIARA